MRILVVHPGPDFSVADVYRGWVAGLTANGCQVAEFNLNDRLSFYGEAKLLRAGGYVDALEPEQAMRLAAQGIKAACYEWWPDLILVVSGFFVPPDIWQIMRDRRHRIVILHTESPYEDDRQLKRAGHADLNLLNDPTNLDVFEAVAPTVYMPHSYNPDLHRPRQPDPDVASDFAFIGTGFPSRIRFFEAVDWHGIDAVFAGNWGGLEDDSPLRSLLAHDTAECCPNIETVRIYTSTKVAANLYRREATQPALSAGWAIGPREVELAACGVFFLRDPRSEGDTLFPMLPTFTGPAEFGDLVRWYLAHPGERTAAAVSARAAVADRTFANHAAELLRLIDKIPDRTVG